MSEDLFQAEISFDLHQNSPSAQAALCRRKQQTNKGCIFNKSLRVNHGTHGHDHACRAWSYRPPLASRACRNHDVSAYADWRRLPTDGRGCPAEPRDAGVPVSAACRCEAFLITVAIYGPCLLRAYFNCKEAQGSASVGLEAMRA